MTLSPPSNDTKLRHSWEVRSILFLLRCMAVVIFIAYLSVTFLSPGQWLHLKWVRHQPLENVTTIAEQSIAMRNPPHLLDWIAERPAEERPLIMEKLESFTPRLSPFTFWTYAAWMDRAGRKEDAVFWQQYMLYRLRFDMLRCGVDTSDTGFKQNYKFRPVENTEALIQKVLDFDSKWPANNDPLYTCVRLERFNREKYIGQPAPEEHWKSVRHTLRVVTEESLRRMKAAKP